MNPAQLRALRQWLIARLPHNREDPNSPIDFPEQHIYKARNHDTPRPRLPVCTYKPMGSSSRSSTAERIQINRKHLFEVHLHDNPTADFDVGLGHWVLPDALAGYDFPTATVSPGGTVHDTTHAILAALQAFEGPNHAATYVHNGLGGHVIEVEAVEEFAGVPLRFETTLSQPDVIDIVQRRDVVEVWTRDLKETSIQIRIETKHADETGAALTEEAWAYQIAEKLAEDAVAREGWDVLACEGVSFSSVSGPVNVSGILGNAQGTEIATLTLRLHAVSMRGKAAGTIECVNPITGTLEGSQPITVETRIEP